MASGRTGGLVYSVVMSISTTPRRQAPEEMADLELLRELEDLERRPEFIERYAALRREVDRRGIDI